jgi:mycofactocin system glycosyltransferase
MRKGVSLLTNSRGCFLTSDFPLCALGLDSNWAKLFRWLSENPESDLVSIAHRPSGVTQQALGVFLHRLAIKGFLVEAGVPSDEWAPRVSVIIPVRNRPEDLKRCLDSLKEVRYPRDDLEIIVVDDASEDATVRVAEQYHVTLLQNGSQRGASFCRNRGARSATGDIFCFIDSDCVTNPNWLRHLVMGFIDERVSAVGGLVASYSDRTALDRYEQVKSSLHMGNYAQDSRGGDLFFYLPSCNLAMRRDVFSQAGGFTESMDVGEDVDLCWRIIDAGGVIEYNPAAIILHRHRNRMWPFCRRRFEYGTSEPLLQHVHRSRRKTMHIWPQAMIFWGLMAGAIVYPMLLMMAFLWLVIDTRVKQRNGRRGGVFFKFDAVLMATVRQNFSIIYHLGAFGSRYYLLPAFLLAPVLPIFSMLMGGVHLGVGVVSYFLKRPRLDVFSFLFFFSLEQLAYQAGVWTGCLKKFFLQPVAPKFSWRKADIN